MPGLNKRQLAIRNRVRDNAEKIIPVVEVYSEVVREDWEVWQADTEELLRNAESNTSLVPEVNPLDINVALFDDGSSYKRPRKGNYDMKSATTTWRRQKEAKKVHPSSKLTSFGFIAAPQIFKEKKQEELSSNKKELLKIKSLYGMLIEYTKPTMNKKHENSHVNAYNRTRYMSIQLYFNFRLEGFLRIESAKKAANHLWPNCSPTYRFRAIMNWSAEFLEEKTLSDHCQGAHVKRVSFLSDNDVKLKILEYIKITLPQYRSIANVLKFIGDEIVPSILGVTGNVCETTLVNYLYEWGYSYRKNKKTIFFDGHERHDVVEYREKWSKRMVEYMERSEFYEGEFQVEVMEPVLEPGVKKIVFVTHDESTFYANDGKRNFWLLEGENYIRKKGQGSPIMISEFQCPCHGTMKYGGRTSRVLFKAGGRISTWWHSLRMM